MNDEGRSRIDLMTKNDTLAITINVDFVCVMRTNKDAKLGVDCCRITIRESETCMAFESHAILRVGIERHVPQHGKQPQ